ncbi:DUF354 domain-containing protein [Gracilimonas sp.]|uniref:DUF354 domain-containing protein n=1 Tax=Gracilimonas sp. TaxID=1974203 RepID=UPI003D0D42C6
MKVLFHLGHPAHYHLFKNVIKKMQENGHQSLILIKEKDVLRNLLEDSGFNFQNILPEGKSVGKIGLVKDLFKRGRRIISFCKEHEPEVLIGTSPDISYVGKFLGIPAINVQEDDAEVVPLHAWIAYPWATEILSPDSCDNGRWQDKTLTYPGYHELAYLHPDHFEPNRDIVSKYLNPDEPYSVLRFVSLNAHHDDGIKGLDDELAGKLIEILRPKGRVIITSERELKPEVEKFRKPVKPSDIHHVLAFADMVIGDSQTMSAEAGVLGTPYIRFNDFVGKLGYLNELENKYELGYGFKSDQPEQMIDKVKDLVNEQSKNLFKNRRDDMLKDKINVADFIYDYLVNQKYNK